jgi:hypothetical protein
VEGEEALLKAALTSMTLCASILLSFACIYFTAVEGEES